ncbi:MAG TPA: hypothetical protein VGW38_26430, partial [Chloroflexota bacterium]|nr:hypothetical protein [Chloroflexota bacterium]
MLTTTSSVHSGPVRITAALGAAALSAAPPRSAPLPNQPQHLVPPQPRTNKIGQFGMLSLAALEQIAQHVEPIQGLHVWTAQALYVALAGCASQQGTASTAEGQRCRVTVAELAARTRMGKRNVQRYLTVLVEAGVLTIRHRHDALHRPVASDYVFSYPGQDSPGMVPPESPSPAPRVAPMPDSAPETTPSCDSGVTTVSQKEESKNHEVEARELRSGEHDELPTPMRRQDPTAFHDQHTSVGSEAQRRWYRAQEQLAATVTAAAFAAWLAPLEV